MHLSRIIAEAVSLRKELHKNPELCWQEVRTSAMIKTSLRQWGISFRECAGTGVVAHIAEDAVGEHLALRADMDGLQVQEKAQVPYSSEISGQMHCCGHDGHMAVLLATARWLKDYETILPGPVTFIFQPAEEGGYGAREMIRDGCLEGVDKIYGWHNWPSIPFGHAVCPDGPVMAANGSFEMLIVGRGGHASQPELCRDPVIAAAAVTMGLQQLVSRRLPPQSAAVVSVTSIDADSGETTIPDTVRLLGTVRMENSDGIDMVLQSIAEIAQAIAGGYGVKAESQLYPRYPAVINAAQEARTLRDGLRAIFGNNWHHGQTPTPIMASEDFSYYLQEVPGAFALVGAGDGKIHSRPCHNAGYIFNDALMEPMVRLLIGLAGLADPACER